MGESTGQGEQDTEEDQDEGSKPDEDNEDEDNGWIENQRRTDGEITQPDVRTRLDLSSYAIQPAPTAPASTSAVQRRHSSLKASSKSSEHQIPTTQHQRRRPGLPPAPATGSSDVVGPVRREDDGLPISGADPAQTRRITTAIPDPNLGG
ncbi:unnamed protein product [Cuscuta campestris]|uniref:Uncharacterized protein n=1 Tax=Cuscuta campestris TaxID=132261 RepID=A0A484MYC7_9ASTE|nr:unnamed protein product [Cuscuta campestris]